MVSQDKESSVCLHQTFEEERREMAREKEAPKDERAGMPVLVDVCVCETESERGKESSETQEIRNGETEIHSMCQREETGSMGSLNSMVMN